MASSDQRDGERVPTFLRVRLRFADVDTFIEKYSTNVSLGGIFIQSRSPKPPGTVLRFEMALEGGEPLIRGEGQVTWVREFDAKTPGQPFGMGVRFTHLDAKSRSLVERAVAYRQRRAAPGSDQGFATSPPVPQGRPRPTQPRQATNGPLDLRRADAELAEIMREAGLTEEHVASVASRAADIAKAADGELVTLVPRPERPPGSPPPLPSPELRAALSPPPAPSPEQPRATPPPTLTQAQPPAPSADLEEPPAAPAKPSRKGRGKRRARATPAPPPEPVVEWETQDEVSAPIDLPPREPGTSPGDVPLPPGSIFDTGDLAGMDLMLESLQDRGPEEEDLEPEIELEQAQPDEPPEITAVTAPPTFADMAEGEEPELFPDRDVATPPPEGEAPEILVDGDVATPPPEGEAPEILVDGDVATPPPEGAEPPSDAHAEAAPPESAPEPVPAAAEAPPEAAPESAPESASDRWAAATGPETENLEAELVAAMETVIEPTPPPKRKATPVDMPAKQTRRRTAASEAQKGKKGILGRIFKKK